MELQVTGDTIYFLGESVAQITVTNGTLRDRFLERVFNDDLYEEVDRLELEIVQREGAWDMESMRLNGIIIDLESQVCQLKKQSKSAIARMVTSLQTLIFRRASKVSS